MHLLGSLAPSKSGVGDGVAPAALTVGPDNHNAIESRTAAKISSVEPQIPRKNCVPFVTVSNFFIKRPFSCERQVSYLRAASVNINNSGFFVFLLDVTNSEPRHRAGNGNRTRMASLEGWNFTIKLCPRAAVKVPRQPEAAKRFLSTAKCQSRSDSVCYFSSRGLATAHENLIPWVSRD